MPTEDVLYFGDSAWCPYGPRPSKEIQQRVFAITDYLLEHHCKLIVIACNSATIAAVEALRATYPIPFVGMEPAVKPAASLTQTGTVGVLATEASIAGEKFHRLLTPHARGIKVITHPCPSFVKLVEAGELNTPQARKIVEQETLPLIGAGADVLVLGCTHYPFLRPLIQDVVGPHIQILDTGVAVAKRVQQLLKDSPSRAGRSSYNIITTGERSTLKNLLPKLCPDLELTANVSVEHLTL